VDRHGTVHPGIVASLIAGFACATPAPPAPLDGSWGIVQATLGGKAMPPQIFQGSALQLAGGVYAFQDDTGDFSVNTDSTPATMDIHGRAGPNAAKTILAIYRVTADSLTICYNLAGETRPKAFASDPGSLLFLVHYARVKP
jgi:uncharacterized protein (TIGR03067 family)